MKTSKLDLLHLIEPPGNLPGEVKSFQAVEYINPEEIIAPALR
jgi:hypothetical protein